MKLLYIWIEEFRNINHQGIVVDDEYHITVKNADATYYHDNANDRDRIISSDHSPRFGLKVYEREIECEKNKEYQQSALSTPISSVSALIGKNAVGKTSILECLYLSDFEHITRNDRYYFMAFLNESRRYIEIRSRGISISVPQICKNYHRNYNSFDIYVIPVDGFTGQIEDEKRETTQFFFLSSMKTPQQYRGYCALGLPTVVGDLGEYNVRNSFCGAFDFLCHFPDLGGRGNKLVWQLKNDEKQHELECFKMDNYTSEDYKVYFIYKLANTVFSHMMEYLYHQEPVCMMDGSRLRVPNEEKIIKEDRRCAELLAPFNLYYPNPESVSLIRYNKRCIPKKDIDKVIEFFENSTYTFYGKVSYGSFLVSLRALFDQLYDLDSERFTAFYKIELPFEEIYLSLVTTMEKVLSGDVLDENCTNGIYVNFEWLSSGEYHVAMLFSAIYKYMKSTCSCCNCHTIWAIDEPEMHMHPELSRTFIDEINKAILRFLDVGLIKSCQFILATHSPFIVQNLSRYNSYFTLVRKEENRICTVAFNDIPGLALPNRTEYSFNLIMYHIFGIPSVELHDELYGELQVISGQYKELAFDRWLNDKGIICNKHWIRSKNGTNRITQNVTLQTYIRNIIHHPENRMNVAYTDDDFRNSIDQMIAILRSISSIMRCNNL